MAFVPTHSLITSFRIMFLHVCISVVCRLIAYQYVFSLNRADVHQGEGPQESVLLLEIYGNDGCGLKVESGPSQDVFPIEEQFPAQRSLLQEGSSYREQHHDQSGYQNLENVADSRPQDLEDLNNARSSVDGSQDQSLDGENPADARAFMDDTQYQPIRGIEYLADARATIAEVQNRPVRRSLTDGAFMDEAPNLEERLFLPHYTPITTEQNYAHYHNILLSMGDADDPLLPHRMHEFLGGRLQFHHQRRRENIFSGRPSTWAVLENENVNEVNGHGNIYQSCHSCSGGQCNHQIHAVANSVPFPPSFTFVSPQNGVEELQDVDGSDESNDDSDDIDQQA